MTDILITAGLFLLIIISLFLILVVLMQRANTNAGLGAAFGGGLTESAFGTEAGNIMSRATWIGAILFFVVGFGLYLGILGSKTRTANDADLPMFDAEVAARAIEGAQAEAAAQPNADLQPGDTIETPLVDPVDVQPTPEPAPEAEPETVPAQ